MVCDNRASTKVGFEGVPEAILRSGCTKLSQLTVQLTEIGATGPYLRDVTVNQCAWLRIYNGP